MIADRVQVLETRILYRGHNVDQRRSFSLICHKMVKKSVYEEKTPVVDSFVEVT